MATTTATQSNDKIMAAVATIPVVGLVIFLAMKDASPLVKNYAKQSNAVLALEIISMVIGIIPIIGWIAAFFVSILSLVAWIMLLVNAYGEKMYKLPVIGNFFDGLLK